MEKQKQPDVGLMALIVVAVILAIIYWKRNYIFSLFRGGQSEDVILPPDNQITPTGDTNIITFGSKGENVRKLQQLLIDTFGAAILPKYGADGQYGNETRAALVSKGFPTTIDLRKIASLQEPLKSKLQRIFTV